MDRICNLSDRADSPGDIRDVRAGHKPSLIGEQSLQLRWITDGILGIRSSPPLHAQAQPLGNLDPRGRVGLMVEFGQDQLITRLELERYREVVQELGR
jgi:hypothetical protein